MEETYYSQNRERLLAGAKAYHEKNREKYRAYWKTYYEKNKQILLEKRKEYARKNKDKIYKKYKNNYYPRHQEKVKQTQSVPIVITPLEETPRFTMIVSQGNYTVSFN